MSKVRLKAAPDSESVDITGWEYGDTSKEFEAAMKKELLRHMGELIQVAFDAEYTYAYLDENKIGTVVVSVQLNDLNWVQWNFTFAELVDYMIEGHALMVAPYYQKQTDETLTIGKDSIKLFTDMAGELEKQAKRLRVIAERSR